MRNIRKILAKLRMFLQQEENPNQLDIVIYCDCQEIAAEHANLNFPHLGWDLTEFGCLALSKNSDKYLERMACERDNILAGQLFVPQIYFACSFKACILANGNNLPAPVPAAED